MAWDCGRRLGSASTRPWSPAPFFPLPHQLKIWSQQPLTPGLAPQALLPNICLLTPATGGPRTICPRTGQPLITITGTEPGPPQGTTCLPQAPREKAAVPCKDFLFPEIDWTGYFLPRLTSPPPLCSLQGSLRLCSKC